MAFTQCSSVTDSFRADRQHVISPIQSARLNSTQLGSRDS